MSYFQFWNLIPKFFGWWHPLPLRPKILLKVRQYNETCFHPILTRLKIKHTFSMIFYTSQIMSASFFFGMSQIMNIIFSSEYNQCTKSHDGKHVLFLHNYMLKLIYYWKIVIVNFDQRETTLQIRLFNSKYTDKQTTK